MSKKKIRPGRVRLADDEQALVVEYESEEFELLQDGSLGKLLDKSTGSKKLKVKNLELDADELASELIEKCKLIKPASLGLVKDLLLQLKEREHAQRRTDSTTGSQGWSIAADASTSSPQYNNVPADTKARSKDKQSRREKMSCALLHPQCSDQAANNVFVVDIGVARVIISCIAVCKAIMLTNTCTTGWSAMHVQHAFLGTVMTCQLQGHGKPEPAPCFSRAPMQMRARPQRRRPWRKRRPIDNNSRPSFNRKFLQCKLESMRQPAWTRWSSTWSHCTKTTSVPRSMAWA